jgi:hypothetical protein
MLQCGVVSLEPLYEFVRKHSRSWRALVVDGSDDLGKSYVSLCRERLCGVSKGRGFCLWGFYNHRGFWTNVYIGKAGLRKTANLYERLFKELTAERACIWREVFSNKHALIEFAKPAHTPKMWPQNKKQWERNLRKAGSTHIFWVDVSHLAEDHIEPIEKDLIEAMNPTGNRKRNQPPSGTLRDETTEVFRALRKMIDLRANRAGRFRLQYHNEFWRWVGETETEP